MEGSLPEEAVVKVIGPSSHPVHFCWFDHQYLPCCVLQPEEGENLGKCPTE